MLKVNNKIEIVNNLFEVQAQIEATKNSESYKQRDALITQLWDITCNETHLDGNNYYINEIMLIHKESKKVIFDIVPNDWDDINEIKTIIYDLNNNIIEIFRGEEEDTVEFLIENFFTTEAITETINNTTTTEAKKAELKTPILNLELVEVQHGFCREIYKDKNTNRLYCRMLNNRAKKNLYVNHWTTFINEPESPLKNGVKIKIDNNNYIIHRDEWTDWAIEKVI